MVSDLRSFGDVFYQINLISSNEMHVFFSSVIGKHIKADSIRLNWEIINNYKEWRLMFVLQLILANESFDTIEQTLISPQGFILLNIIYLTLKLT